MAVHPSSSRDRYNLIKCMGEREKSFSFIILTSHCRNTDVCMNHIEVLMEYKYMQKSLTQALTTLSPAELGLQTWNANSTMLEVHVHTYCATYVATCH